MGALASQNKRQLQYGLHLGEFLAFRTQNIETWHSTTSCTTRKKNSTQAKVEMLTLVNPMSFAYTRKHWRHMLSPYLRIKPCWLEHTRQWRPPLPYFLGCELTKALEPMISENGAINQGVFSEQSVSWIVEYTTVSGKEATPNKSSHKTPQTTSVLFYGPERSLPPCFRPARGQPTNTRAPERYIAICGLGYDPGEQVICGRLDWQQQKKDGGLTTHQHGVSEASS